MDSIVMAKGSGQEKVRLTTQRLAIMHFLKKSTDHPDADTIFRAVRARCPSLSRATVYNSLCWLKKRGLVKELACLGEARHFDGVTDGHHHIICVRCHRIQDVLVIPDRYTKRIKDFISRETGSVIHESCFMFYGLCDRCDRPGKRCLSKTTKE